MFPITILHTRCSQWRQKTGWKNRKFCVLGKLNMKMMERCNDHLGFYSKQKMPPFYTVADFFFVESEFLYFDRIWIFSESDAMNLLWEEGRLFLAKRRRLIADGAPSLHITHHVSASRRQWWWWWWNYYHHLHPASMIMECGCVRGGRGLKGVGKWAPNSIACCRQWPGSAWWSYYHGIQNISQSISGLLFRFAT